MTEVTAPTRSRIQRAARVATVWYFICCAIVLPFGAVIGTLLWVHVFTATPQPTGAKTAAFRHHEDVLYNTPQLLAWRNRLIRIGVAGGVVLFASGGVMALLRRLARADAVPPPLPPPARDARDGVHRSG